MRTFPSLGPNDNGDATEPTHQSLGTNGTWPEAPDVGWAVWWFWSRDLSGMPTLCLPVVCSLPARGYLQLFVFSMRCGLTTPPFMQVLAIKRQSSCDIRARYCDAMCAAMTTQFLYRPSCSFRLGVAAVERNCARAGCASWCGDTRQLCAQQWFGLGDKCTGLSFERSGAVLCADPQHRCAHPSPIVVTYALAVAEPCAWAGARRVARCTGRLRSTLRGQSAAPCAQCCLGCASNARGCRSRMQRERAADVRTSKLRPCPGCNGSHGIVATLG